MMKLVWHCDLKEVERLITVTLVLWWWATKVVGVFWGRFMVVDGLD